MQDFEKLGVFYLGREYDLDSRKGAGEPILYDARDLMTHAVCVGMTGSGKTGLCVALLEEAAIDRIPAIVVDPKGDLGNLLLTFPDLQPGNFRPWIDEDEAHRNGISPEELARQRAELWRHGLAAWGQDGDRIRRLRESAEFSIYTPGSDAGIPVSALKSFDAPPAQLRQNREAMRERLNATATALLALLDIEADPLQSREHILIANLLDTAWNQGLDVDLATLIHQIQKPPITRVGVLDLESFYPSKDRFKLAMLLNNLLASPGFEAWMEGEPLDIDRMLYTAEGKPRITIFSIAHLTDSERMFFVSLLLAQTLGWMRRQSGATSLRALFYMDEIFGYFPPTANPPSKTPLLTLLKQARAFGLGVVLATQNPVDLDYKGLSNCGTWFVGRLQTERDKNRLLDGLEGAAGAARSFDRQRMDRILSGLGNRVFLMNNVHDDGPRVFETRWTLSYLRGPMTRPQIRELMSGRRLDLVPASGEKPAARTGAASAMAARPLLPPDVPQHFLPVRRGTPPGARLVYQPCMAGSAEVRFFDAKRNINESRRVFMIAEIGSGPAPVNWAEAEKFEFDPAQLETEPHDEAHYVEPPPAAARAKGYAAWSKDLVNWIFGNETLQLLRSPGLGAISNPGEQEREFRIRLQQAARERRDAEAEDLRRKYAPKRAMIEEKVRRAQFALQREQQEAKAQKLDSVFSVGSGLLGAFLGRKVVSKSTLSGVGSAARSVSRAARGSRKAEFAEDSLDVLRQQARQLDDEFQRELAALHAAIDPAMEALEPVIIRPLKMNISLRLCSLLWLPFWRGADGSLRPAR